MAFGKKNKDNAPDVERKEEEQFVDLLFDLESGELSINDEEIAPVEEDEESDVAGEATANSPEGTFVPVKGYSEETAPEETGEENVPEETPAETETVDESFRIGKPAARRVSLYAEETEDGGKEEMPTEWVGTESLGGETAPETAPDTEPAADSLPEEEQEPESEGLAADEAENEAEGAEEEPEGPLEKSPEAAEETRIDKVKAEKLEALIRKKSAGNADYAKGKLSGFIGVSKDESGAAAILGLPLKAWLFITLSVFTVDALLLNFLAYKVVYPIVEIVMKNAGIQALGESLSKEPLYTVLSYGVSFIFCGLLVFILSKLTEAIAGMVGSAKVVTIIRRTLIILAAVFAAIGIVVMIASKKGLFTLAAYRWFCPAFGYLGGFVFFAVSQLGKKKKG